MTTKAAVVPITPKEINAVRAGLPAALANLCRAFDLEVKPGSASYSSLDFTMKVKFTRAGQGEAAAAALHNDLLATRYGLAYGDIVTDPRGEQWKIAGTTRSERYPLLATRVRDGKGFRIGLNGLTRKDGTIVKDKWAL